MSEKAIADKKLVVEEIKEKINKANLLVVADYLGFSVKEMTGLRKKLRSQGSELKVLKNTLLDRAVSETGFTALKDSLKGSTAVLFGYKDAVAPLKIFVEFLKEAEKGGIRGGLVEKGYFGDKDLREISKLPGREVLLAKAVGGLQSPLTGLVNVLQGPIRKLVYALNAIKEKKGGE